MLKFILRRLLLGLVVVWIASVLVFAATELLPGNTATAILGERATPAAVARLEEQLGLNQPPVERYTQWLAGVVTGDLGRSLAANQPVSALIGSRLVNTLILMGITVALLIPLSYLLGTIAAVRRQSWLDVSISSVTLTLIALPEFVVATLLILVLAIVWPVLPAISFAPTPIYLILPVVTLLAASLAQTTRMVRANMIDALDSAYVQMTRLEGFPERRVVIRHALRNALIPSIQVFGLVIGWLMGGTVVVETVFGYSGIGQGFAQAVSSRDIPVIQAVAMIIAAVYVGVSLVADLAMILLTPKLRTRL